MINSPPPHTDSQTSIRQRSRAILIALLFPTMAIILNGSMFGVALPTIRDEFGMTADVAAWLTIAFTLPFMMLMPLYGRLSDELGRSRLLLTGILVFGIGSLLALVATSLPTLFFARVIQGIGSAGVTPISLALIAQRFSVAERGRALGTWNSIAPGTSIFAPSVGGFLIDTLGWRTIFIPILGVALFAFWIVRRDIPSLRGRPNWAVLRTFDWGGTLLLGTAVLSLVLFVSSRPVTGVAPLQDWRFLVVLLLTGGALIWREGHHPAPLFDLHLLRIANFRLASLAASLRMAMMIGIGFLIPLYLTDVYGLSASTIGLLASIHSTALFISIRYGGSLADRRSNRRLIAGSLGVQALVMGYFSLLPGDLSLLWVIAGTLVHGAGAGLSLAALHRTALGDIDDDHTGAAAGVYSMTRFGGSMLGIALAGVILQNGLDRGLSTVGAYQIVYAFLTAVGLSGVLLASRLRER